MTASRAVLATAILASILAAAACGGRKSGIESASGGAGAEAGAGASPVEAAAGDAAGSPASAVGFGFSSGGEYHPSGYGEWVLEVTGDGALSVVHAVAGKTEDVGTFALSSDDAASLWKAIGEIDVRSMKPSERPGVPDEVKCEFSLDDDQGHASVAVWMKDAIADQDVADLLALLRALVEKHSGQAPVF